MTLPTIPDNFYKFCLYIGLIILGYIFINSFEYQNAYNSKVDYSNSYIDSLKINKLYQERKKELMIDISENLSKRYAIENPIKTTDSTASFSYVLKGTKEEFVVSDSINKIWNKYSDGEFQIELLNKKIEMTQKNLEIEEGFFKRRQYLYLAMFVLGITLAFFGFIGMGNLQKLQDKLIELEIKSKNIKYNFCQSCGKNFNSMRENSKDHNGEINFAFCTDCFDNGVFTENIKNREEFELKMEEELSRCKNKKERNILAKRFKSLERWNIDEYK